jgi:hypothetical protein
MNRKMFYWVLALFIGGATMNLKAQGTSFLYQGHLNDGGSPANGNYDFTFSLYDASTNGNLISGPQTNLAVAVAGGLFTTNINFGAVFTGTNYWLAIGVRTNGSASAFTTLQPLQPLLPVPYAIFANTAGNLSGTLPAAQLSGTLSSAQLSGTYSGAVSFTNTGNTFFGNGGGLANLNGSQISSGTVADARLSTNVALLNGNQAFSGTNLFKNINTFTNNGNSFIGSFFGNGLVGWIPVSNTSTQAMRDAGYLLLNSNLTTVTLPAMTSLLVGDIIRISGAGLGGWQIAQNTNQSIIGSFSSYNASSWLVSDAASSVWINMAASADGSFMAGVVNASAAVYASTDYGHNWSASGSTAYTYRSVACSSDGSHLIAGQFSNGSIYYSTNYGANWNSGSTPNSGNWFGLAMSANGSNAVAVAYGGGIYTSTNGGASWRAQTSGLPTSAYWESVASSADGSNLVAVATNNLLYTSANAGFNWTSQTVGGSHYWAGVASSADSTKLVAVAYGGGIFTSANSGVSWQQTSAPSTNWESVTCSSDGGKITAVVMGGYIYSSINFGANWTKQTAPVQNWLSVCGSADGTRLAAGINNGGTYYSSLSQAALISTTSGTNGFVSGGQGSAVELQYIGNGQFMPVSSSGTFWAN